MFRAALPAFALAALISGCARPVPGEPAATPVRPAPPSAPAPARKADPMVVWSRGVGAVGAHTPFTVEAVKTAWPEATVEKGFLHAGGAPVPIITVQFQDGRLELQGGADGKVKTIRVDGGGFRGPGGETLSLPWSQAKFAISDCRMGDGRAVNALVCKRPGADNIAYVFGIRGWASNETPPAEVLTAKAFLSEFVWTAPA
jgi:hypothetical protein